MMATLAQLVFVPSQLAEDLLTYYAALLNYLDRSPWPRMQQLIRASEIAIPARVLKEESKPMRSPFRGRDDEDERQQEPARHLIDPEIAALYEEPTMIKRREEVAWNVERQRVQRAVIIGAPGGGKSFLTAITAVEVAQEAQRLLRDRLVTLDSLAFPIHVELNDLAEPKLSVDPGDALLELFRLKYKPLARLEAWVREKLMTEQCWLILDALDQVDERHRPYLNNRLKAMETQGWRCHIVLTCRTANYDRAQVPWGKVTEYELAPFNPREIRQFVEKWFGVGDSRGGTLHRVLDRSFPLSHACRNPLIATLACLVHERGGVTEETRRVDLYERVMRNLVGRAWKREPLNPLDPHIGDVLRPLPRIARTLFELRPESNQFTEDEIFEAIKAAPDLPSEPIPFRDELLGAGILTGAGLSNKGEVQFSFLHRTFLEYLTACALNRQAADKGWQAIAAFVDQKVWHPAWQEVMMMLSGKLSDPMPLLKMLANPRPTKTNRLGDDLFRHRLTAAVLCLSELDCVTRISQSRFINKITTTAFFLWWRHQRNHTVSAVFALTYALPSLAYINGKVKRTPLLDLISHYLDSRQVDMRLAGLEAIERFGTWAVTTKIFDQLEQLMKDSEQAVSDSAGRIVSSIRSRARGSSITCQETQSSTAGQAAAHIATPVVTPPQLERLAQSLSSDDPLAAHDAAGEVEAAGSTAATPEILTQLGYLLIHKSEYLQLAAVGAIRSMGSAAATPEFLAQLADYLSWDPEDDSYSVVEAVGAIGSAAATPEFLASLTEILNNGDIYAGAEVAEAISRIGSEAVTPEILDALIKWFDRVVIGPPDRDYWIPNMDLATRVASSISYLGSAVAIPEIIARLIELPYHSSYHSHYVAEALGRIGRATAKPEILARLTQMLQDLDPFVRSNAANAIALIGKPAATPEIINHLMMLMQDRIACSAAADALKVMIRSGLRFFTTNNTNRMMRSFIKNKFVTVIDVKDLAESP